MVLRSPMHVWIGPFGIRMKCYAAGGTDKPKGVDHIRVELARAAFFGGWELRRVDFGAEMPIDVEQFWAWNEAGGVERLQVKICQVKFWHADSHILPVNEGGRLRQILRQQGIRGSGITMQKRYFFIRIFFTTFAGVCDQVWELGQIAPEAC